HESTAATAPIGRFTKKIQCQVKCWMMNPPIKGPKIGPTIIPIPKIVFAVFIFSVGKAPITILCAVASSPPPPSPCKQRHKTSSHKEVESPHISEQNVKMTTEAVK